MTETPWWQSLDTITPHVVHISTPRGSGTGFLLSHANNSGLSAIATAAHVIDQAHYWEEPIRILHPKSGKSVLLKEAQRSIYLHPDDTAAVVMRHSELAFPDDPIPMLDPNKNLKVGNEIGWLGFPALSNSTPLFLRRAR